MDLSGVILPQSHHETKAASQIACFCSFASVQCSFWPRIHQTSRETGAGSGAKLGEIHELSRQVFINVAAENSRQLNNTPRLGKEGEKLL